MKCLHGDLKPTSERMYLCVKVYVLAGVKEHTHTHTHTHWATIQNCHVTLNLVCIFHFHCLFFLSVEFFSGIVSLTSKLLYLSLKSYISDMLAIWQCVQIYEWISKSVALGCQAKHFSPNGGCGANWVGALWVSSVGGSCLHEMKCLIFKDSFAC